MFLKIEDLVRDNSSSREPRKVAHHGPKLDMDTFASELCAHRLPTSIRQALVEGGSDVDTAMIMVSELLLGQILRLLRWKGGVEVNIPDAQRAVCACRVREMNGDRKSAPADLLNKVLGN
jgi:hypothetical protein